MAKRDRRDQKGGQRGRGRGSKKEVRVEGKNLDQHHITPRSRGGGEAGNVVTLPAQLHDDYHRFFGSLTLEESITYLRWLMTPGAVRTRKQCNAAMLAIKRGGQL